MGLNEPPNFDETWTPRDRLEAKARMGKISFATVWTVILLAGAPLVAGCAFPTTIVLKDSKTGAVQQCQNAITYVGRDPAEECAQALERDGWVRLKP
jgi:hypothetical protein